MMKIEPLFFSGGYKYQVRKYPCSVQTNICPETPIITHRYSIGTCGLITANPGYAWDGATKWFEFRSIRRGSLFHDIVCQAIKAGLLDPKWGEPGDDLLYAICIFDRMFVFHARAVRKAVKTWRKMSGTVLQDDHPIRRIG